MTVFLQPGFIGIEYPLNHPRIGWRSRGGSAISSGNAAGYPASNALDVRTALAWKPNAATGWVGVSGSSVPSSYCGVAGHDLGTQNATVAVERWTGSAWANIVSADIENNDALMFLFNPVDQTQIRLRIVSASSAPRIGHVRFGTVTELPRPSLYAGTTPISESRQYQYDTLRSNGGAFLGRSIVSSGLSFPISVAHLSEDWRRSEWAAFREYANTENATFFYADRPAGYPEDVAYAWSNQALSASRNVPNKRLSVQLEMQCEAL